MSKTVKFRIELESNGEKVLHDISVSSEELRDALEEASAASRRLGDTLDGMAAKGIVFSAMRDAVDVLNNAVGGLASEFNSFDKGMRAVNTMAGVGREELAGLKGEVERLAETIPLAKEELAGGLYQVISNGVPKDNWISFLEKSARSSVGGMADLGQTVTVTSTIIKNYGLAWDAAGDIQDKIQTTAKYGVTSFEQLGQALPRVSGNAATLGVSVDELMATFATLTGVSGNTAEVSTQLAAVFTALVKPSGEAAEMARQMGVQFDAAAVKAAGGMQNFLRKLSLDISQYAAAHGMLEQEIYGRLFGSAEALRALIPLTGELSDTFTHNVEAMADSGGTIDRAFEDMSGSGEAVSRMLRNQLTTMLDWAGGVASGIQPYVSFVAVTGQAIAGLSLMGGACRKAVAGMVALSAAQKKNTVVAALAAMHEKVRALALNLLTSSSLTATAGTWALTAAVTALYAALTLGVSAVITGLVSLFSSMGDEAEDSAGQVDTLRQSADTFRNTVADTKAEIDMELVALANLIRQHGDESDKVAELNRKYGEALGCHKTAAEWYDTLIGKSRLYCTQMGYEAQARALASQIASKTLERESKMERFALLNGTYLDKDGRGHHNYERYRGGEEEWERLGTEISALTADIDKCERQYDTCLARMSEAQAELTAAAEATVRTVDWEKMSYTDLGQAIEAQKTKVAGLAGVDGKAARKEAELLGRMSKRYETLGKLYGLESNKSKGDGLDGKKLVANAKSYKELGNNIAYYQTKLEKTSPEETQTINLLTRKIGKLKEAQAAVKALMDSAGRPTELDTLEKINAELSYQQELRKKATAGNIAGIDAEIRRLNDLKTSLEACSHTALGVDRITTYEQLETETAYYENRLKKATATERTEIQKQISALRKLRSEWDAALEAADAPADISLLNTIGELEEAASHYSALQKRAGASEVESYQRAIDKIEAKREALNRLTEIPSMQRETADLAALDGKRLRMELELIGLEGIRSKIRDLQKMLDDTRNPLGDEQRKEVRQLIGTWRDYEAQLKRSQVKLTTAWGGIKGIGDSVGSVTDALKGNGSAWEKVSGVIDGVIALYDGFNTIVGIIQTLTAVSTAHTAAKTVEATAESAESATMAASGATATATSLATAAALGTETAAWSALSAAKTFAAHAGIPFAGTAIASGFITAQQAAIAAAAIPKFADGGIAYGPALGVFGEYAGAARNPEVVAPLDKLRAIIGDTGGSMEGTVDFRIRARRLEGVLRRENKRHNRT